MSYRSLFATPIAMYEIPGMDRTNRELTGILVAESAKVPSMQRSNAGGWHSKTDLQYRTEPCFRTLVDQIVARVRETAEAVATEHGRTLSPMRCRTHCWAMVMRHGHYTIPHDHAETHWATVYYADAGDADESAYPDSGLIAFLDPRHGGRPIPGLDLVGGTFLAKPATGRLFVFPGWLLHYVHAYWGRRPRVSISCNVLFEGAA
jgi:uncharacterized protein (TIGR02466 family)